MPAKYRTILVPTDLSELSSAALDHALALAGEGSRIILCHVVDDMPLTYGYVGIAAVGAELRTRVSQEANEELEEFARDAKVPPGVRIERRIVHGTPFAAVIDLARKEGADLIVMSTHGRTGLKHMLIGSVAERVVRQAPCPVLVVRPESMVYGEGEE